MKKPKTVYDELKIQQMRNKQLIDDIIKVEAEIAELKKVKHKIIQEKNMFESQCQAIQQSYVWKCSKPIRKLRAVLRS